MMMTGVAHEVLRKIRSIRSRHHRLGQARFRTRDSKVWGQSVTDIDTKSELAPTARNMGL
jgi:hypothetical protein